jgi:lysophospholipase L1-like esterase
MLHPLARWLALVGCLTLSGPDAGADPAPLRLTAPVPYQVVQRDWPGPVGAKAGSVPAAGHADIPVRGDFDSGAGPEVWEYRVVRLAAENGEGGGWARLDVRRAGAVVRLPAGGWYRLEVRGRVGEEVTRRGAVEPVGVGDVFLVAGQSYATNYNDERLQVTDPERRVAALDPATGKWRVADDPQPVPDGSDGGSIWPPVGDALAKELGVPVGFANVAVGATSSAQWLPDGKLFPRMVVAGKALGAFRALLWQQGESDVIAKTTTEKYVANLKAIRSAAADAWGLDVPWLPAKSTHHPTVYHDPEGEARIRKAVDELAALPGFRPGPDTDALTGDSRGDAKSRRHFTGAGQRRAAELWVRVLKEHVTSAKPVREPVSRLRLLDPAWASPVVYLESSILLQLEKDGPLTARLAFPAAEVLEVATAGRRHTFDPARDFKLSADGLVLTFTDPGPVEPIRTADLFPPNDAPNSYRHRLGHPDQNLLYRPGRWFHDRDVEVTSKRREAPAPPPAGAGTLPKTVARLKAGRPLVLGVSGDSISTGLDASGTAAAPPYQPGYPDLVAAQLEASFGGRVTVKNRAVAGWSVENGVADVDKLVADKPDLVLVAYGMNDVGRRDPKWFGQQTKALLDRVRTALPDAEVVLVSPMLGNAEWVHTPRDMFVKYRDALTALAGPGVALADVTVVWELLLKHKHDLDLTGNGLNHPNDFGHRVYAQTILALFPPAATNLPPR